jgi:hypothetical protein
MALTSCGTVHHEKASSFSGVSETDIWRTFYGKTYDGEQCALELAERPDGTLARLRLGPYFRVTTPILGGALKLGTFDTAINTASGIEIKSSGSREGDTITGSGWHIFRDKDDNSSHRDDIFDHKVVVKPSLAFPRSVTYSHKINWHPYYFGTRVEGFCSRLEEKTAL